MSVSTYTSSWTTATTSVQSTSVQVPSWARRILVASPAALVAASTVYLQVSFDGTSWFDVRDNEHASNRKSLFTTASMPSVIDATSCLNGNYYTYGNTDKMYLRCRMSGTAAMTATHTKFYFGD